MTRRARLCRDCGTFYFGNGGPQKRCQVCRAKPYQPAAKLCTCGVTFTPNSGTQKRCNACRFPPRRRQKRQQAAVG